MTNDNEDERAIRQFKTSYLLGFTYGTLANILTKPDSELREGLETLKNELEDRVSKLYY